MSLTLGTGPLARPPSDGQLNADLWSVAPAHALSLHPVQERIRGVLDGRTVVDTTGALLLHETGLLPRWYLPGADAAPGLLQASATRTTCPFKGEAHYWHLVVDGRTVEDTAWSYPDPVDGCPPLAGLVSFYFEKLDTWLVENDEQIGHPRDPFHRVDARHSLRHVVVKVGGEVVAETSSPIAVFETGLPVALVRAGGRCAGRRPGAQRDHVGLPVQGRGELRARDRRRTAVPRRCVVLPGTLLEARPAAGHRSFDGEGVEHEVTV